MLVLRTKMVQAKYLRTRWFKKKNHHTQSPCHSQPSGSQFVSISTLYIAQFIRPFSGLPKKFWGAVCVRAYQQCWQGMLVHQQTPSKTRSSLAAVLTCQPLFSQLLSGARTLNHSSPTANIKGEGRMTSGKSVSWSYHPFPHSHTVPQTSMG